MFIWTTKRFNQWKESFRENLREELLDEVAERHEWRFKAVERTIRRVENYPSLSLNLHTHKLWKERVDKVICGAADEIKQLEWRIRSLEHHLQGEDGED